MSKVSAFNVYRNKNKGNKKEDEALTQDVVDTDATSPTQITTKTKVSYTLCSFVGNKFLILLSMTLSLLCLINMSTKIVLNIEYFAN